MKKIILALAICCFSCDQGKTEIKVHIEHKGGSLEAGRFSSLFDSSAVYSRFSEKLDLELSGIRVETAPNGNESLKLLLLHKLDGVFFRDSVRLKEFSQEVIDFVKTDQRFLTVKEWHVTIVRHDFNNDQEVNRNEQTSEFVLD